MLKEVLILMIFKKILITATFAVSSLIAIDVDFTKVSLHKDMNISKQLEYLKKNDSYDRKFELGIYFGELILYNPNIQTPLIDLYKYNPERDTLFIALKKAGIKNDFYPENNNYRIIDPMKYKKYYYNSVKVLIGSFRFHLDMKYLDKIKTLEGCSYSLCEIPYDNILKEYKIEKNKEVKSVDKNTSEDVKFDLPF